MSIKDSENKSSISGADLISFIKTSRLREDVFINNLNISNNIKFNGSVELDKYDNYKEGDILIFNNFDEYIELVSNKEKKFELPSTIDIKKNEKYLYKIKKSIKIINNEEEDFYVKLIGISKNNLKIEVIGDSQDFFYNNLGNKITCDIGFKVEIEPQIESIEGSKVVIISKLEIKDKKFESNLNDIITESKEIESRKLFLNILLDFENETLFM